MNLSQTAVIAALFRSDPEPSHIVDDEFGRISIKRRANARYVRLRMSEDGEVSVTLPKYANIHHAEDIVDSSREQIRSWLQKQKRKVTVFQDGDRVGRSHVIKFHAEEREAIRISTRDLVIHVYHPRSMFESDPKVQKALLPHLHKAMQKEARAYLPRRLRYLAEEYGFSYERVRFGTQKGRWGSCSSRGTISLNVGLMLLEPELIDYVLVHELCHTKQMNHSAAFWSLVESCLPDYKSRRKLLRQQKPTI